MCDVVVRPVEEKGQQNTQQGEDVAPPKCCDENSFDNVRVMRGQMTLRCRNCESKMRAQMEKVRSWKCSEFWTRGECPRGVLCHKLHIHFRKKSLKERVDAHGPQVLDPVLKACQASSGLKDPNLVALLDRFSYGYDDSPPTTPTI